MGRDRLVLTILAVGCVLFFHAGCQEKQRVAAESKTMLQTAESVDEAGKAETSTDVNAPSPKITFENVVHDFGQIGPKTENICEFKFTNTGDSLLKITEVSKSCGCTPFTLDKEEYAPGESGVLKVKYNSDEVPGEATKLLFVYTNDKETPKATLTIKATIVTKVDYEPKKLNLVFNKENAGCPKITIKSIDNQAFAITSFESTAGCITADIDSSAKATEFVIDARVDVEKLKKALNGHVSIGLTHPESDNITIIFETLPRFTINPPTIIAFNSEPKKAIKKEVWVLNNYGEDFEVESAGSSKNIIKVLKQEKVGNRYKFELEIVPPVREDKSKIFTDVFYVNLKDGEKMEIMCRGFYSGKTKKPSSR